MPRPISALISPSALRHNLSVVRQRLDRQAEVEGGVSPSIWAVIKANAYGHGIERAVGAFSEAQGLAMLDLEEAVRCREAGWGGPIMLLEGFFQPRDLDLLDRYHLSTAIHCQEQLDMLAHARPAHRINAMLKLNSGMNRLGFAPDAYARAFEAARALQGRGVLGTVGKMTHFATADGPQGPQWQWEVFEAATQGLPGPVSVCNSAGTLRYPRLAIGRAGQDIHWVRPGICLYGASPFDDQSAAELGLRPAMTLRSELIGVQHLQPGQTVGYGATFTAPRAMRIGVVACGYADGYPRHCGTGTPITVAGVPTRVLGRVSMDMLAVDLEPVAAAGVGSPVVLWGEGGPGVDEVAAAAGTIGYELLTALAQRVPVTEIR
ncbi:alanine racemase [Bordetella hinzii]|uniref:Alanine racemase n=1 Tax=Bordetella hinzii TaxID=103855 RepID=A0AAN1RT37_9BORD|nr:alanine racemase [Bordetella hinzii]AKQ59197.1 Alanine racemase, catabolic [Bordetella hinzii]AZW15546.1 alanine racemase [Bordetella hinzii]MBZ0076780.1 alanine racemase [Bordetella hinzii]MBZ0078929.1 alanine racemase [Bordetella hinzii]MBZ0083443.1 alanine racemase [Bordetella hinzii]